MAACTLTPWVSAACFGEGLKYCTDLECCQNKSSQTHLNIEIKDLQKEEIHKWLSVSLPIPLQFELRRTFNQFMRIYSNPIFDHWWLRLEDHFSALKAMFQAAITGLLAMRWVHNPVAPTEECNALLRPNGVGSGWKLERPSPKMCTMDWSFCAVNSSILGVKHFKHIQSEAVFESCEGSVKILKWKIVASCCNRSTGDSGCFWG